MNDLQLLQQASRRPRPWSVYVLFISIFAGSSGGGIDGWKLSHSIYEASCLHGVCKVVLNNNCFFRKKMTSLILEYFATLQCSIVGVIDLYANLVNVFVSLLILH
jgi:hypothetical protein